MIPTKTSTLLKSFTEILLKMMKKKKTLITRARAMTTKMIPITITTPEGAEVEVFWVVYSAVFLVEEGAPVLQHNPSATP
jgi:hypothetical protein